MDVTFNNVLEGTRQYFLGLPKAPVHGQSEGAGQPLWPAGAPPPEEGAPALSGAPTPSSRPPSAAAAPPTAPIAVPPRPPSEPLEPEPHIIHKATVMREAAEKRREQPDPEDEEEPVGALSPPSHIIHKPPLRTMPSPAPATGPLCPSPARPPSAAPLQPPSAPEPQLDPSQYRQPVHRVQTPTARPPDHFAPGRPPDPYSVSRPPESYARYHYEASIPDGGRNSHGPPVVSPQPSAPPRHSPQTYARLSSSMPQHAASRLREAAMHSPPSQRYVMPSVQPPPLPNDRVPPIHHPPAPPSQRVNSVDSRSAQYPPLAQRREPSPYGRTSSHYDRHPALPQRKYDPQQAYPGYRPMPTAPQQTHRVETHHQVQYKHAPVDTIGTHYATRPLDRIAAPPSQHYPHEATRHPHESSRRTDYSNMSRTVDTRSSYHYSSASTSTMRYAANPPSTALPVAPTAALPLAQSSTLPTRVVQRPSMTPKSNYDYPQSNHVPTSPVRSAVKPGCPNQQARMTVSVTSLVNQMNQTKQKRESPLDLSVKTVKNSADSSTTQDDMVDSATAETKSVPLHPQPTSSSRQPSAAVGYVGSHKVDFAPDFTTQYRERSSSHNFSTPTQPPNSVRYNGSYEAPRLVAEPYPVESRHHVYHDRSKYSAPAVGRNDYVPRIDLTRTVGEERRPENRIRDDRHFIIEERKRPSGPIVSNIPEKIVRYETWSADSRIDRLSQSVREQKELMSRPVYSYSSHKQFEAYQACSEQKRVASSSVYREQHSHANHRYPYQVEVSPRDRNDYHSHHHDRNPSTSNRHVIQKIPSHRDIHSHQLDPHSGIPADKRVLSILRNSLETKQTHIEPTKSAKIPDLIVIDDVDDSVIEITDLTKDNDGETNNKTVPKPVANQTAPPLGHHIQMPKAVDSISRDSDYQRFDNADSKSKSPENDVASRIRTKAELKVLPPSQDHTVRPELKQDVRFNRDQVKIYPKSQKQHLFNQIREDSLRLESVIKSEKCPEPIIPEVKTEPMNIDEIEKDAAVSIKTEPIIENVITSHNPPEDLDWANACDSFMEQLKVGCHKKKPHRKRIDTLDQDNSNKTGKVPKTEPTDSPSDKIIPSTAKTVEQAVVEPTALVIKQEPVDEDEIKNDIDNRPIVKENNKAKIKTSSNTHESIEKDKDEDKKLTITEQVHTEINAKKVRIETNTDKLHREPIADKSYTEIESPKASKVVGTQEIVHKDEDKTPLIKSTSTLSIEKDKSQLKKKKSLSVQDTEKGKNNTKMKKISSLQHKKESSNEKGKNQIKLRKSTVQDCNEKNVNRPSSKNYKDKTKKSEKTDEKRVKSQTKPKVKLEKNESASSSSSNSIKKEILEKEPIKTVIKEELESTDDDEPLIKSKILKEKEIKYQLLKDLSEKSAYVKLECFDVDMNKNTRISIDSLTKDKEEKQIKNKISKPTSKSKGKSNSVENIISEVQNGNSSSDTDDDDLTVASRLRLRKNLKGEGKHVPTNKTLVKPSPSKKQDSNNASSSSTPIRKPGFGDGSDFHPGWEEELYRYKRSLRMPTRLIAIPRSGSGGPFVRGSSVLYTRGSTSLPDLDPAPLSPAPSSAPSAATDDLFARRPDKLTLDSDLDSNSSCSAVNRLHYDSEASTSTVFSSTKKKGSSIVDVLIQKCGKRDDSKKKNKDKDEKSPKIIPKSSNSNELLPTPSLGLIKNGNKGSLSAKKEKLMEDIFYLGAFRKETVTAFRNAFIKNTDGLIGATEEFAPVVLKSRTRTESRVLKQRATIKEVFGDERPASAPPACINDSEQPEEPMVEIKKEPELKPKLKPKKIIKDKMIRRSSSIRDGLRSTKSLKRNDAKGRLLRLKKRNSLMKSLASKRIKDISGNKIRKEKSENTQNEKEKSKEEGSSLSIAAGNTKRRLKRLFGRRKFSSGFDYIRKKKKIIRREDTPNNKIRRPAPKPSPESVHDIQKEIKGWFINKSIGETHLHRAARLGYTDCVAYCLEKMEADPSAKDNAGFTPLHFAASKGHVRIARLLLQYGANVSAAAQGGIRPLHEASENSHVEVIRLLLSYGADPALGTYAGQTPEELAEGPAARLLRLHIADVQGKALEPWRFPLSTENIDREELGCDPLSSPPPASPPPPPDSMVEIQCTDAPLPPFYSLRAGPGQPSDGLWCLLQDITNLLQIKSKESLLKQIHCGSGSPKELLREIRTQEFLERAQCHQLLGAGEKVNVRASKVSLVRVTDKLRQLLKIETVLVS